MRRGRAGEGFVGPTGRRRQTVPRGAPLPKNVRGGGGVAPPLASTGRSRSCCLTATDGNGRQRAATGGTDGTKRWPRTLPPKYEGPGDSHALECIHIRNI